MRSAAAQRRGTQEHKYSAAVIQGWGATAVLTLRSPMACRHPGPGSCMGPADPPPRPASRRSHRLGQRRTAGYRRCVHPAPPGTTARGGYRKTAREGNRLPVADLADGAAQRVARFPGDVARLARPGISVRDAGELRAGVLQLAGPLAGPAESAGGLAAHVGGRCAAGEADVLAPAHPPRVRAAGVAWEVAGPPPGEPVHDLGPPPVPPHPGEPVAGPPGPPPGGKRRRA